MFDLMLHLLVFTKTSTRNITHKPRKGSQRDSQIGFMFLNLPSLWEGRNHVTFLPSTFIIFADSLYDNFITFHWWKGAVPSHYENMHMIWCEGIRLSQDWKAMN